MKHLHVVAAVICHNNKYLCMQRNKGKYTYTSFKYEFPGGKIENDETHEEALKREIQEEMHYQIDVGDLLMKVEHQYPDLRVTMYAYACTAKDDNFKLLTHVDYRWLSANQLETLDWCAADLPIVRKLKAATSQ